MADDRLSLVFGALADPVRRAILTRLSEGEATVGELAQPFAISAPAITKHLRVLTRAGLISQGRDRQFRPCRIEPAPLRQAADWAMQYRALWEARLDRLDDYLQALQQREAAASAPTASPAIPAAITPTRKSRKARPS